MEFTPVNGYDSNDYYHQYSSAVVPLGNSMHIWRTASSAVELPVRVLQNRGLVALDSDGTSDCRPQSHRAQTGLCRTGFSETGLKADLQNRLREWTAQQMVSIEQRQRLLRQEPFFGSNNVDFGDTCSVDNGSALLL
jgi:hypothetical protein